MVISALLVIKRGTHNIRECDDELFKKIDQYRKCWGESKYHYIKQIQIINLYYKENGKVDELVKKGKLIGCISELIFYQFKILFLIIWLIVSIH